MSTIRRDQSGRLTRVVTDGAADVPVEVARRLAITAVPGMVHFGEEVFVGEAPEFWRRVRAGGPPPSTAPPTVAALAAAFAGEEPALAIHVSAELSRTEDHARAAAGRVPNAVRVIDSRSMSVGTALLAITAAEAAHAGLDLADLHDTVCGLVERVHVHAVIDAVDYLLGAGRAGLLDTTAIRHGARQVVAVKGHAILLRQTRDRHRAIRELLDHLARDHVPLGVDRWAIGHGDAADVDAFVTEAGLAFGTPPSFVALLSPTVGTHTGPDALVVGLLAAR
jgi:DegV family protein with EDD domain